MNASTGAAVAESIQRDGGTATFVEADVTDSQTVKSMVDEAVAAYGKIDALINIAGKQGMLADVVDMPEEEWNRVLKTNITSVFICTKHPAHA